MGAAIGVLYVVFTTDGAAPGLQFFTSLVIINFVVICVAAISYFASAITEEKADGTLALLRLTQLSPFAILLGKSTSRLLGGLLLLLVQLPFALLAITLGGVRLDQVVDCYLLLAALLFFACNAGLVSSVLARHTAAAGVLTAAFAVLYFCWPLLVELCFGLAAMATGDWSQLPQVPKDWVSAFCVPVALADVLASRATRPDITGAMVALFAGGAVAFVFARLLFERFCSEEAIHGADAATGIGRRSYDRGREHLPGRAWVDAICWRDFYFLHGGKKAIVLKSFVYLALSCWVGGVAMDSARQNAHYPEWWYGFSGFVFGSAVFATAFESLFATSRIYRLEQKERTLAALRILPQRLDQLLHSKRRAVFLSLAPGLFFVAASFLCVFAPIIAYAAGQLVWIGLGLIYLILQILLHHYLVGLMSLRLRWGALPLVLGISVVGNYLASTAARPLFPWSLLPLIAGAAYLCMRLRSAFHRSLIEVAGEE